MPRKVKTKKQSKYLPYSQKGLSEETSSFKNHMFDLESYGGIQEVNRLIDNYASVITEEEKEILRNNAPSKPNFQVLTQDQYNAKGCSKRRGYRNQVKDYFRSRESFFKKSKLILDDNDPNGELFATTVANLEMRKREKESTEAGDSKVTEITTKKKSSKKKDKVPALSDYDKKTELLEKDKNEAFEKYSNEGAFLSDIEATPEEMDAAFKKAKEEEYANAEKDFGAKEYEYHRYKNSLLGQIISTYKFQGYNYYNKFLRQGKGKSIDKSVNRVVDYMKKETILNRDLVVRRGVVGRKALSAMMGVEDINEAELQEKIESGNAYATEYGFMSTSLPTATVMFDAGDDKKPGVEFIILLKKGTSAMNISGKGDVADEGEVLVAPGTKFKIVAADTSGKATFVRGGKQTWKVYLVSVPSSEGGIKKENNAA
ncbi:MAG: ADP-ribosyltransferase [Lachnospiraceae bacterium]|nr:ADP-ribosyltransferase [Lachnospiraceae bacterium]